MVAAPRSGSTFHRSTLRSGSALNRSTLRSRSALDRLALRCRRAALRSGLAAGFHLLAAIASFGDGQRQGGCGGHSQSDKTTHGDSPGQSEKPDDRWPTDPSADRPPPTRQQCSYGQKSLRTQTRPATGQRVTAQSTISTQPEKLTQTAESSSSLSPMKHGPNSDS